MVKLGTGGSVCVYTSAPVELIVDVVGWTGRSAPWVSINPARVTDTRRLPGGTPTVAAGSIVRVPVSAASEVDAAATAAAINVTAVDAQAAGFLTVFPCGTAVPVASNVNFQAATATANAVITGLVSGEVCIYTSATVNIIVDVMGWTSTSGAVTGVVPQRVADTRQGQGGTRLPAGTSRAVNVGRPSTAGAVAALNVTAADSKAGSFLTVHACNGARPNTSNVNVTASGTSSGLVLIAPDAAGNVCVYSYEATDLVVDLNGWMNPSSGYRPVTPKRLVDTRQPLPPPATPTSYPNVASGVSVASWLTSGEGIPASSASEPSGNFRTFCEMSHLSYDDPIVYPGQPGASHLHMFFGNTLADANSTYQSLRTTGSSTCQGGPLNRSAYWMPAIHNAAGKVVAPEYLNVYYKGNGTKSGISNILTNPNGLRMIAGYNAANPGAIRGEWSCNNGAKSTTVPACGNGQTLSVELRFPMCWNGRDLDSADHRSHMAYGTGGAGWITAQGGCPATHPFHLPEYTLIAVFTADGNSQNWYAASDRMPGMPAQPNGSTYHADWFGAWENSIQDTWTQECIREMRNCVWGELGDGTRLPDRAEYTGPTLLDPPPR